MVQRRFQCPSKKKKKLRNFREKPAGKGKHKVHMGFDFASLTAEDKDAENGSDLKGNWDKLMKEQASKAIEYNVTTLLHRRFFHSKVLQAEKIFSEISQHVCSVGCFSPSHSRWLLPQTGHQAK